MPVFAGYGAKRNAGRSLPAARTPDCAALRPGHEATELRLPSQAAIDLVGGDEVAVPESLTPHMVEKVCVAGSVLRCPEFKAESVAA